MTHLSSLAIPLAALLLSTTISTTADAQRRRYRAKRPAAAAKVIVNGKVLPRSVLIAAARRGLRIANGRYWYDRRCGLWGYEGGPARGIVKAGLRVGGRLKSNASRGRSGVFVNGRQLTYVEAYYLYRLVRYLPRGYYWLDRRGNAGRVGGPRLVNLVRLAKRAGGGRSWLRRSKGIGGRGGLSIAGDGKTTCVNTPGYTRCY